MEKNIIDLMSLNIVFLDDYMRDASLDVDNKELYSNIINGVSSDFKSHLAVGVQKYDCLSDFELREIFFEKYIIDLSGPEPIFGKDKSTVHVKVNHGFWEFLGVLYSSEQGRCRLSAMNIPDVEWKFQNQNLEAILSSWYYGSMDNNYLQYISLTTGKYSFFDTLGIDFSDKSIKKNWDGLPPYRRGALLGLLGFSHIFGGNQRRFVFGDSFFLNNNYEKGSLTDLILEKATDESALLVIGPPRLSGCSLIGWPGSLYSLSISLSRSLHYWRGVLQTIKKVLDYLISEHPNITILFQGGSISSVVALFIRQEYSDSAITFFDLGRLLDSALGYDVTQTGSPLPTGGFDVHGVAKLYPDSPTIFHAYEK